MTASFQNKICKGGFAFRQNWLSVWNHKPAKGAQSPAAFWEWMHFKSAYKTQFKISIHLAVSTYHLTRWIAQCHICATSQRRASYPGPLALPSYTPPIPQSSWEQDTDLPSRHHHRLAALGRDSGTARPSFLFLDSPSSEEMLAIMWSPPSNRPHWDTLPLPPWAQLELTGTIQLDLLEVQVNTQLNRITGSTQ